jgi:hypothetical protein
MVIRRRRTAATVVDTNFEQCNRIIGDAARPPVIADDVRWNTDNAGAISLFDALEFDDQARVRITNDGYLVANPRIARTGIQVYLGSECGRPDLAQVRVMRPADSVFHTDAMHSYAHRPITIDHPGVRVTADNWKEYAVGQTGGDVVRDGGTVRVPTVLMDAAAIQEFKNGKKQLSVGYTCNLDWTPGEHEGQKYDAVQTNIRANHLAVVANARGGPQLVIGDNAMENQMNLKTVMVDGINCQMTDTAAEIVLRALKTSADTITQMKADAKKRDDEDEECDKEDMKKDELIKTKDAEIATLRQQLADAKVTPAQLDALVKARQETFDKARALGIKGLTVDGKSVEDVQKEVVTTKLGDAAKGWDAAQIAASFNTLTAGVKTTGSHTLDHARQAFGGDPAHQYRPGGPSYAQGGVMSPQDQAYSDSVFDLENGWRGADWLAKNRPGQRQQ